MSSRQPGSCRLNYYNSDEIQAQLMPFCYFAVAAKCRFVKAVTFFTWW
ncbi:MAG: hypothetical protein PHI56_09090 [Victivallaceae bacterium]|nr:hypothetical protein [Victivallaceae bacterium]MDD3115753.1 hypothetical protein [Victivallaceae bacterium]MDD5664074.1 hypothetical protein [Victivallaceae bacterium]